MEFSQKRGENSGCGGDDLPSRKEENTSVQSPREVPGLFSYGLNDLCQSRNSISNDDDPARERPQIDDDCSSPQTPISRVSSVEDGLTLDRTYLERFMEMVSGLQGTMTRLETRLERVEAGHPTKREEQTVGNAQVAKPQAEKDTLIAHELEMRGERARDGDTRRRFEDPIIRIGGYSTPVDYPQPSAPTAPTVLYPGSYPFADKMTITPFKGDSSDYCRFERDLKMLLETSYRDDMKRYLVLQQLCEGPAKLAVTNCFYKPEGTRYEKAVGKLRKQFGRPHMVANRVLNELLSSVKGSYEGAEAMSMLVLKMKDAELTLAPIGLTGDLDASDTLNKIVKALPLECRVTWAHLTATQQSIGGRASFHDLYRFIKQQANVRSSQYGGFMQSENADRKETRPNPQPMNRVSGKPNTTYGSTSVSECPICRGSHRTEGCPEFSRLPAQDKWTSARTKGVTDNLL